MDAAGPVIDRGARQRLKARFGSGVEAWFDELPRLLIDLAQRWAFELGASIPRGSVSVVFRGRMADGQRVILKASPDHARLALEAAALATWETVHAPRLIAFDDQVAALMIEAIEPGTALIESWTYPELHGVVELLTALHREAAHASFPVLFERVDYLFRSSAKLYERHPEISAIVSLEVYEHGRALATRLAVDKDHTTALLHGDLTPSNVLDGGAARGLVAIDPAPCLGDPVFDAIDLTLWQADDLEVVHARAQQLAGMTNVDTQRLLDWCAAFAGMNALELASQASASQAQIEVLTQLASRAKTA